MIKLIEYFTAHLDELWGLTAEHIQMTAIAVGVAILVGVPLGILISYVKKLNKPILGAANVVQAIPSMALLGLGIPLMGIGQLPAVVMVIIYSLLPIIKNTYTGLSGIDPLMVEAASGIGLTNKQILGRVKLPMALPVIMAGVRISSVTAVGLMTMAAFIGAGGLGYMVFAGIRTVNNYQIMAGAIPACILALLVDYLMSLVEKLVTPISLQGQAGTSKEILKKRRRRQKGILGVAAAAICVLLAFNAVSAIIESQQKQIIVGSKDFTEQFVLCSLYGQYIEDKTDIKVVQKSNLGGSQVAYEAVKNGDIDMYVDYTGTLYGSVLNINKSRDMKEVYNTCVKKLKPQGLTLTRQCNFNNTYTMAVSDETAEKYGLDDFRDLAKRSNDLRLGCTLEFQNRHDCLEAFQKQYPELKFKKIVAIDSSPRFIALKNNEVEVVDAFATDGMLKKFKLKVLKDPDQVFPPYYAVPVFNSETIKKYPELKKVVDELSVKLTDEVMIDMNYQVDCLDKKPSDVARKWLIDQGLIKKK